MAMQKKNIFDKSGTFQQFKCRFCVDYMTTSRVNMHKHTIRHHHNLFLEEKGTRQRVKQKKLLIMFAMFLL